MRSAVKEQVESLGAKFLELDLDADAEGTGGYAKALDEDAQRRQQEQLAEAAGPLRRRHHHRADPGQARPQAADRRRRANMKPGSVIVDLAGEAGGNCELTQPGQTIVEHDVTIAAPLNLPSDMPDHSSQLYARNIMSLLELMAGEEGALELTGTTRSSRAPRSRATARSCTRARAARPTARRPAPSALL